MFEIIWVLLVMSFIVLILVLPIIFPFSKIKRWVSQLFMFVVYVYLLREYLRELYFLCDVDNKVSAGAAFGIVIFQIFAWVVFATFVFNIFVSFYRRRYKVNYIDIFLLILFVLTPFYIESISVNLHYEFGCKQLEPLGNILFVSSN